MDDHNATIPATPRVESAFALARGYPEELPHLEQVAGLAVVLFEALEPLHHLGQAERELLCCAALLHDIGISAGYARHHKHSRRLILQGTLPALVGGEQEVVASIARYHRKAVPRPKHKGFAALSDTDRQLVRRLAAILRLADGLDRAHENAVVTLRAQPVSPVQWAVNIYGRGDLAYAAWAAERKADLFADIYGVAICFEPKGPPD